MKIRLFIKFTDFEKSLSCSLHYQGSINELDYVDHILSLYNKFYDTDLKLYDSIKVLTDRSASILAECLNFLEKSKFSFYRFKNGSKLKKQSFQKEINNEAVTLYVTFQYSFSND